MAAEADGLLENLLPFPTNLHERAAKWENLQRLLLLLREAPEARALCAGEPAAAVSEQLRRDATRLRDR